MIVNWLARNKVLFAVIVLLLVGGLYGLQFAHNRIPSQNQDKRIESSKSVQTSVVNKAATPPKVNLTQSAVPPKKSKSIQSSSSKKAASVVKASSAPVKKSITPSKSVTKTQTVVLIGTPTAYKFSSSALAGSQQIITVTSSSMGSKYAEINCYEKAGGQWRHVYGNMFSIIGENGMEYDALRKQNTNTTPSGVYSLPYAFGWEPNPGGLKIKYRQTTDNDYWDLNSGSPTYNQWVEGNPGGDSENLGTEKLYQYAIVIGYNLAQVPDKGGAIFMHINPTMYTGGCVGISETNILKVLRWLDPAKNPKILICPQSDLSKYN